MRQSSYVIVTAIVIGFIGRVCVCALWKARMSPPNPKVLEGSPLEINCTLLDGVADTRFNSSDLFIEVFAKSNPNRSRRIPDNFYDRPNSRTLQMVIPEASSEDDDSSFICNLNRSAYGEKVERVGMLLDARIGRLPGDVNPSIVSRNLERLQLSWCTNQVGVSYSINYRNNPGKSYVPKEVSQITDHSSTIDRVCWRSEWEHQTDPFDINIEGKNKFGSRTVYKNDFLTPRSYVKLNQTALKPLSIASRWIRLEWIVSVGHSRTRLIQCRLTCSSTSGSTVEEKNLETLKKEDTVNLTNLHPFTDYNVSMSCQLVNCTDCLWSDWSTVRVKTSEDVPSKSPILQSSFYRIKNCSDQSCHVKVFWKPVPENSRNGIIEGYVIEVNESNDVSDSQSPSLNNLSSTTNGYEFAVNRTARVTVEVRAFTKAGESPSASIAIRPPQLSQSPTEDGSVYGEQARNNSSQVLIGWKTATKAAGYDVVYCFRDERENVRQRSDGSDVSPPCDAETLSTEYAPSNASNVTITLRSGLTLIYSVAAVLDDGVSTTGLLTDWQHCIYDGGAEAAQAINCSRSRGNSSPTERVLDSRFFALLTLVPVIGIVLIMYIYRERLFLPCFGAVDVVPPRPAASKPLLDRSNLQPDWSNSDTVHYGFPNQSHCIPPAFGGSTDITTPPNNSDGSVGSSGANRSRSNSNENEPWQYVRLDSESIELLSSVNSNNLDDDTTSSNRCCEVNVDCLTKRNRSNSNEIEPPNPDSSREETATSDVDSNQHQIVDNNDGGGGETTASSNPAGNSSDSLFGSSPSISDDIEPYSHIAQADIPTSDNLTDISSDCSDDHDPDRSQVQQSGPSSSSCQPDDGYQAAKLKSVQNFSELGDSPVDPVCQL